MEFTVLSPFAQDRFNVISVNKQGHAQTRAFLTLEECNSFLANMRKNGKLGTRHTVYNGSKKVKHATI